ncbi:hypothetical protein EYC84_003310 [Monilinia fructicola]|uniref:Uncharacterized protein n=1 Tax=Monilinia fructicola TaxID=38448 RepID=A0A5M9JVR4_MONFR|nr:hypothetical protein EYC84_003310 [Monilinia fructicola]
MNLQCFFNFLFSFLHLATHLCIIDPNLILFMLSISQSIPSQKLGCHANIPHFISSSIHQEEKGEKSP